MVIALGLAIAAVFLYAPSWSHGFVGDDSWVTWSNAWVNEGVRALPRIVSHSLYFGAVPQNSDLYRPVAGIYFTLVGVLTGHTAGGYHVVNTLLYGLDVVAVFMFFTGIADRSLGVAFVATALFIVHPIHTEVVNNIKSADELLCLLFLLLSAATWLRHEARATASSRALAIVWYALAVGSKETAVPMVVVFPALWYFFRRRRITESVVSSLPFAGVSVLFVVLRSAILASEPAAEIVTRLNNALVLADSPAQRIASALGYVARYAKMLVWPHPLSFDYTFNAIPLQTFAEIGPWLGVPVCLAAGAAIIYGSYRKTVLGFSALWISASMILVVNLVFLISTNFGERLLYLPSVMACYLLAWLLARSVRLPQGAAVSATFRSPLIALVTAVLVVAGSAGTLARSADWIDEPTLFTADLAKYPDSARLNNFVGSINFFAGDRIVSANGDQGVAAADFTKAREYLSRGLELGGGNFLEIHAVLGMAEYQLKDCAAALPHLQQAMSFTNYRVRAMEMMGDCYEQSRDSTKALDLYRRLDTEGVAYPHGWFVLGNDAAGRGDDNTSTAYFKKVIGAAPDNVSAFVNLALGDLRLKRFSDSLGVAEQCLALQPQQARCLVVAAEDEGQLGHPDKAAEYAARARAAIK